MKKIESFKINHLKLNPGLYVSRVDTMDDFTFTTFDLRVTKPNTEPVMNTAPIHTIEHIAATWFRDKYSDITMYFGPMGCRTGFYLILKGKRNVIDTIDIVIDCFKFILEFEGEIPGASAVECGNYLDQNLQTAKYYAKKYILALEEQKENKTFNYPR